MVFTRYNPLYNRLDECLQDTANDILVLKLILVFHTLVRIFTLFSFSFFGLMIIQFLCSFHII